MSFVKPRLSEKSFAMSQATNTYAVDVPKDLNKYEISDAVKKQFGVETSDVRIVNRKGKVKRVMNISGRRSSNRKGTQPDMKKAYVTLAKGSHLPFFAAAEEEIAKEAEAKAKAAKKSAKTEPKTEAKPKGLKKLVSKKETK